MNLLLGYQQTDNGTKFGPTLKLVSYRTIIGGETAEEAKTSY
jgi:hypothetical protein